MLLLTAGAAAVVGAAAAVVGAAAGAFVGAAAGADVAAAVGDVGLAAGAWRHASRTGIAATKQEPMMNRLRVTDVTECPFDPPV